MNYVRRLLILFTLFLSFLILSVKMQGQDSVTFRETVLENFAHQLEVFPQEKIYAHLDRFHYLYNDTIWYSLYLLDATTHQPLETEQIIYAELINEKDSVVNRVKIAPDENNRYYGYFAVLEEYGSGHFTFRAYAPYMYNAGEESFFTRSLIIAGVSQVGTEVDKDAYEVQFFPEGGYLLDGTMCYVGFKSLNHEGLSLPVTGEIIDEEGTVVTSFESNRLGMGMFTLRAEVGKKYMARYRAVGMAEKEYELPQPITQGYGLMTKWANNRLLVSVQMPRGQRERKPLFLLVHCRGVVQDIIDWDFSKEFVAFEKELFPSGVLHFVLLDAARNIYSERLTFCLNEKEMPKVDFHANKVAYHPREQISTRVTLKDQKDQSLRGILSVSVTDNANSYIDTTYMMTSSLLLRSELKGNIETPEYYFAKESKEAIIDLDYLMLTQGWRRYDVASILKEDYQHPDMEWDGGLFLSGTVMGGHKTTPLEGSNVTLYATTGDFFSGVDTDNKGRFSFLLPTVPDSTLFRLQAKPSIRYGVPSVLIDTITYPKVGKLCKIQTRDNDYMDFSKVINLPDVSVTARRRTPRPSYPSVYSRLAIQSFDTEYFDSQPALSWEKIVSSIPGAKLLRNGVKKYISLRSVPVSLDQKPDSEDLFSLVVLDDMVLSSRNLDDIDLYSIARIDVIKGPRASIFGSEGMAGVISITTRQDNRHIPSEYVIKMLSPLGYQQPVEFYSPQYRLKESLSVGQDLRKTIYWKPNLETNEVGEIQFDFYAADIPTTYTVVIEGVDSEGNPIRYTHPITVSPW